MGTGELGSMGEVVNMSMLFTVGGLLVWPVCSPTIPTPSESRSPRFHGDLGHGWSGRWRGFHAHVLTGEFTANAAALGAEDVAANSGGFT